MSRTDAEIETLGLDIIAASLGPARAIRTNQPVADDILADDILAGVSDPDDVRSLAGLFAAVFAVLLVSIEEATDRSAEDLARTLIAPSPPPTTEPTEDNDGPNV